MSTADPFGSMFARGFEAMLATHEDRLLRLLDERLEQRLAAMNLPSARAYETPPRAAKAEGVGVRKVYAGIKSGAVETRSRNLDPANAKQIKLEVNVESLRRYLRGEPPAGTGNRSDEPIDAQTWARQRLARKGTA
jgi:hypothetical protein